MTVVFMLLLHARDTELGDVAVVVAIIPMAMSSCKGCTTWAASVGCRYQPMSTPPTTSDEAGGKLQKHPRISRNGKRKMTCSLLLSASEIFHHDGFPTCLYPRSVIDSPYYIFFTVWFKWPICHCAMKPKTKPGGVRGIDRQWRCSLGRLSLDFCILVT